VKPLDLSTRPPRSPREKLADLFFLPRTIDKMRALLPGGNIGSYKIDGMSTRILAAIGVSVEDLQAEVARAGSDEEVATWVLEHTEASKRDEANHIAMHRSIKDVPPENLDRIRQMYPDYEKVASGLFADIIDADDAAMFAREERI
jgi:hypothetical protein